MLFQGKQMGMEENKRVLAVDLELEEIKDLPDLFLHSIS